MKTLTPEIVFLAAGLLLSIVSWPLARRRIRPNRWYGLRVPATFADEQVWYDANAVAGRDMMILGIVVALVAVGAFHLVGLRGSLYAGTCAGLLVIGTLALAVRHWRVANRMLRERRAKEERSS